MKKKYNFGFNFLKINFLGCNDGYYGFDCFLYVGI